MILQSVIFYGLEPLDLAGTVVTFDACTASRTRSAGWYRRRRPTTSR